MPRKLTIVLIRRDSTVGARRADTAQVLCTETIWTEPAAQLVGSQIGFEPDNCAMSVRHAQWAEGKTR
jgi:hypothetical protein